MFIRRHPGKGLPVLGVFNTRIQYEDQVKSLPLLVVKGSGDSLFGRNWLEQFQVKWSTVHSVRLQSGLLQQHDKLFREEVGLLKGMKAKIYVAKDAQPRFCKSHGLPYCLESKVEAELDRLQPDGSWWGHLSCQIFRMGSTDCACGESQWTNTHLWGLQVNSQSSGKTWPVPTALGGWPASYTVWCKSVH